MAEGAEGVRVGGLREGPAVTGTQAEEKAEQDALARPLRIASAPFMASIRAIFTLFALNHAARVASKMGGAGRCGGVMGGCGRAMMEASVPPEFRHRGAFWMTCQVTPPAAAAAAAPDSRHRIHVCIPVETEVSGFSDPSASDQASKACSAASCSAAR